MDTLDNLRYPIPKDKWEYSAHFREYLLLLATKRELGLEFKNNYPAKIELSRGWHTTLNTVRDSTKDDDEHWAYVGFKSDRRSLWFPAVPATGYDAYVPSELIREETRKAKDKFGIVDLLGDIHSHPTDFLARVGQKLPAIDSYGLRAHFSAGDLYIMANTEYFRPFMGVVEGDYNLFAFRTRETTGLVVNSLLFSQEAFEKYWYEKNGFRYLGGVKEFGANRAIPISPKANSSKVNI